MLALTNFHICLYYTVMAQEIKASHTVPAYSLKWINASAGSSCLHWKLAVSLFYNKKRKISFDKISNNAIKHIFAYSSLLANPFWFIYIRESPHTHKSVSRFLWSSASNMWFTRLCHVFLGHQPLTSICFSNVWILRQAKSSDILLHSTEYYMEFRCLRPVFFYVVFVTSKYVNKIPPVW